MKLTLASVNEDSIPSCYRFHPNPSNIAPWYARQVQLNWGIARPYTPSEHIWIHQKWNRFELLKRTQQCPTAKRLMSSLVLITKICLHSYQWRFVSKEERFVSKKLWEGTQIFLAQLDDFIRLVDSNALSFHDLRGLSGERVDVWAF